MGEKTGIRWADATENPIRVKHPDTGKFGGFYCVKISPGCTNCYAAREVARGRWGPPVPYVAGPNAPELYLERSILEGWAGKTRPKKRFVSSMTDIAGEFVPDEWYYEILDAQLAAPLQTFLNLTKRADRTMSLTINWMALRGLKEAPANMWMGFSAESQEWFDSRWQSMRRLYELFGFVVWVSAEPLLGPIVLPASFLGLGQKAWVVTGGESGPKARPCHPQWVRDLRDQCAAANVPFFHKQWGEWSPVNEPSDYPMCRVDPDGKWYTSDSATGRAMVHNAILRDKDWQLMARVGKHEAGHLLDGQEWSQFPSPDGKPADFVEGVEFTTLV